MAGKSRKKSSILTILLIVVAVVLWIQDKRKEHKGGDGKAPAGAVLTPSAGKTDAPTGTVQASEKPERQGGYEVYRNCRLVDYRNNDGDSFMLKLPVGRQAEFRLYFVDTPESAFKTYGGGQSNHGRISQQAADLGGITPQQAVEIGKKAKHYTLGLLAREPFTIYTEWDSPFNDNRYHAFVQVKVDGKPRWLHQVLVEKGLVRIITKPADTPDGIPAAKEKNHLRELESAAKRNSAGAWGL